VGLKVIAFGIIGAAKVEQVPETGHSVYFQRPEIYNRVWLAIFF
jgi:hypothetical protein